MPDCLRKPSPAEIARRNGACGQGPVTAAGKARAAQNALRHGLRAEAAVVPALGEDEAAWAAHLAAVAGEVAARGVISGHLARTIAGAIWRCRRAERVEAELFARVTRPPYGTTPQAAGDGLVRDPDALRTLALVDRYRAQAEGAVHRALDRLAREAGWQPGQAAPAGSSSTPRPATAALPNEPGTDFVAVGQ